MAPSQLETAILGGIFMVIGYFVTARVTKSGSREVAIIERLESDLNEERSARKELDVRVERLFNQVQLLITRDTLWEIHSSRLENQIIASGDVPAPRPTMLTNKLLKDDSMEDNHG